MYIGGGVGIERTGDKYAVHAGGKSRVLRWATPTRLRELNSLEHEHRQRVDRARQRTMPGGLPMPSDDYVVRNVAESEAKLRDLAVERRKLVAGGMVAEELQEVGTTPEPTVPGGGKGLWRHKGWSLPSVIQHVFNDLVESGHPHASPTYRLAVGIVQNWAAGHDGKGHRVKPAVQAKAAAAIAEWEAKKGATKLSRGAKAVAELVEAIELLEADAPMRKARCPKCSALSKADVKTCPSCGHNLAAAHRAVGAKVTEGAFDEAKHPRGSHGQWRALSAAISKLSPGGAVKVDRSFSVHREAKPSSSDRKYRVTMKTGREPQHVYLGTSHFAADAALGTNHAGTGPSPAPPGPRGYRPPARGQSQGATFPSDRAQRAAAPKNGGPTRGAKAYLAEPVNYGGIMTPRGEVIRDLKKKGGSQAMIDRYLQGLEAGARARKRRTQASDPGVLGALLEGRSGPGPLAEAQGALNPSNTAQVKSFQQAHGLKADGIVGPETRAAAASSGTKFDEARHPRGGKGSGAGGKFVARGSSGASVSKVQKQVGAKADGRFGAKTERAVRQFQKTKGLKVDGIVGRQTAAALRGSLNASTIRVGPLTAQDQKFLGLAGAKGKGAHSKSSKGRKGAKPKQKVGGLMGRELSRAGLQ